MYHKVASTRPSFRSSCWLFQIVSVGKIWCLFTATFWEKVDLFNSRPVYYSRLYGILQYVSLHCCDIKTKYPMVIWIHTEFSTTILKGYPIQLRGTVVGKTSKTLVLPGFCGIERGACGSGGTPHWCCGLTCLQGGNNRIGAPATLQVTSLCYLHCTSCDIDLTFCTYSEYTVVCILVRMMSLPRFWRNHP